MEDVLAGPRLCTRPTYVAVRVTDLVAAGFGVLATFGAPHVSIVLPEYDEALARVLASILGPERPNPHYVRTSR